MASTPHEYFLSKSKFMNAGRANLSTHKIPRNITGNKGGYSKKLSGKFPSRSNERDRCAPQVAQSIPNSSLYAQGSITLK